MERIELNEEHVGRRLIMTVALLLLGVGALAYAFVQLVAPEDEWITVEASSSVGVSCASEFSFLYRPGGGERSYAAEKRAVTALYSRLCREAFELFSCQEAFEGVNNVYAINRRPNEVLEVDEGLYRAFSTVDRSGSRAIYLGPVYSRYNDIFFCQDDSQLADFDPRLSEDVAEEYLEIARFANDPQSVRLELLGEGKIRLYVSEEYLSYARERGIDRFIDFAWMRNAFAADYMAEALAAEGCTHGVLRSYDGFIRNLDAAVGYSLNLCDYREGTVYGAAVMNYRGPMGIVCLRDYPASELDQYRFYRLRSGEVRTPYLDPEDGLCKSALHDLACYAENRGCGEILLAALPVYAADELRPEELARLAEEGVQSVYCQDRVIWHTDPALELAEVFEREDLRYTAALLEP